MIFPSSIILATYPRNRPHQIIAEEDAQVNAENQILQRSHLRKKPAMCTFSLFNRFYCCSGSATSSASGREKLKLFLAHGIWISPHSGFP